MKRPVRYLSMTLALLAGSYAHAKELPNYDASLSAKAAAPKASPLSKAAAPNSAGVVTSVDAARGVPTFLWAMKDQKRPVALAGVGPEQVARHYLAQTAHLYGLSNEALSTAVVKDIHDTGRGGILVILHQVVGGVPLFQNEVKVLMNRSLDLVAIGGNLHPSAIAVSKRQKRDFKVSAPQAIANAFENLYGIKVPATNLRNKREGKGGYTSFDLAPTPAVKTAKITFTRPARAKKVFFPMPSSIVPAYYLEIQAGQVDTSTSDAYGYVIAADDGRLLLRRNLTHYESFDYTVWADNAAPYTPLDGPTADFTPHPTGMPDNSAPAYIPPINVSMEGFNTNPNNMADPWLPDGATETYGNNVDAYVDYNAPDGLNGADFRATTTGPNKFNRIYDTAAEPLVSTDQSMAATTQLFYVNNWLHDWWYDSGFNETAGNAQLSNFGRGGVEGDPLHAEAQDNALGGSRNNANMNTPDDGESPRMQMYLWNGQSTIELSAQPLNVNYSPSAAAFGPASFNISADLVLGNDGAGASPTDGCEPISNNVAGKIVLVDRGNCTFKVKSVSAQAAGAVGIIVANNVPEAQNPLPPTLGDDAMTPAMVNIGVYGIVQADGNALKAELGKGPVTMKMVRIKGVERDGTIDNGIVAHEWGHYIHHRLVNCGTNQCGGQSEGWGDFMAVHMALREGDNLDGTYAAAVYSTAILGDAGYFGIRRVPYSIDLTKNGLTFKHIMDTEALPNNPIQPAAPDNSEVHNIGEIWATMLFDAYIGFIKNGGHTFTEAKRRMGDYVVAGMRLAPANPTITEQRDGILAAAAAADAADFKLIADGFARRGAGTCAESPPRNSVDMAGVIEDFMTRPKHALVSVTVDDSIKSCDGDGLLDAEESGKVTIEIQNTGAATLKNTQGTVTTAVAGVSFPNGATVTFADIEPFQKGTATVDIALDPSVVGKQKLELSFDLTNADACVTTLTEARTSDANLDNLLAASATDDVESDTPVWTLAGTKAQETWTRVTDPVTGNNQWVGADVDGITDRSLESPDLKVSAAGDFVITFAHRYEFEIGQGTFWDGGVMEITEDGGTTWTDLNTYTAMPYGGTIGNLASNPLSDREAFVDTNPAYPATDQVSINLGPQFAGKTVRIRFRIGTDEAAAAPGWEIDNIGFAGIDNTPFPVVKDDGTECGGSPVANAGPDQTVGSGSDVTLSGTESSDPENDPLTFAWKQTAGPSVQLTGDTTATPSFMAPDVKEDTLLTFEVTVNDGKTSDSDTVDILVKSGGNPSGSGGGSSTSSSGGHTTSSSTTGGATTGEPSGPPIDDEGGCGCTVVGEESGTTNTTALASFVAMAALAFRRRRKSQ